MSLTFLKVGLLKGIAIFSPFLVFEAVNFHLQVSELFLKQIDKIRFLSKIQGLKSIRLKSTNSILKVRQSDTNVLKVNLLKGMIIFSADVVFEAVILHLQVSEFI